MGGTVTPEILQVREPGDPLYRNLPIILWLSMASLLAIWRTGHPPYQPQTRQTHALVCVCVFSFLLGMELVFKLWLPFKPTKQCTTQKMDRPIWVCLFWGPVLRLAYKEINHFRGPKKDRIIWRVFLQATDSGPQGLARNLGARLVGARAVPAEMPSGLRVISQSQRKPISCLKTKTCQ